MNARGALALVWLTAGCPQAEPYPCSGDGQCEIDGALGRCEPNGYCSYEAQECGGERRWGPHAGDDLADGCLGAASHDALYAACVGQTVTPSACEAAAGAGRLDVDLNDGDSGEKLTAYLIFDLGELPEGSVLAASLVLTAPDTGPADSDGSGRIFEVEPFTAAALESGERPVAGMQLAPSAGAVALGQTVRFELPPERLPTDGALYLAIEPDSPENVQYWSASSPDAETAPRIELLTIR